MNCKNVCDLPQADGVAAEDYVLIVRNGKAVKLTLEELQSYSATNPGIVTDKELTQEGRPADGAAVGAALAEKLGKILTADTYGDTLPEDGQEGQIFFLAEE